jgi:F0F1-type ATP synthase membrane subunit b/b'
MITLRQQIVDLALGATTKVVGESLDADRHGKLIDEYIAKGVAEA